MQIQIHIVEYYVAETDLWVNKLGIVILLTSVENHHQ